MELIFINEKFSKESIILSALRGPDNDSGTEASIRLKMLTTGRIRGFVLKDYPGSYKNLPLSEEEQIKRDQLLKEHRNKYGDHFFEHYQDAALYIKLLTGYDLWTETQVKNET